MQQNNWYFVSVFSKSMTRETNSVFTRKHEGKKCQCEEMIGM